MGTTLKYQWLTIILALIVLGLCVYPKIETQLSLNMNDKLAHFLAFAAISFAAGRGLKRQFTHVTWVHWLSAMLLVWLWGGMIELIQAHFIPTRFGDWLDFFADGIGVLLGWMFLLIALRTPIRRWI